MSLIAIARTPRNGKARMAVGSAIARSTQRLESDEVGRKRGWRGLLSSTELLVMSPLFGVLASVFLATGEPRYRIPWDASFIILAVELYRRR